MQAVLPRARIKRTVACSQFGTTEEDHDPSVSAHTRHRRRQLRVQLLRVSARKPLAQGNSATGERGPLHPLYAHRCTPAGDALADIDKTLIPNIYPLCRRR